MADVVTQDPETFPVSFSVDIRRTITLDSGSTSVDFAIDDSVSDQEILRASYFFDSSFSYDRDIFTDPVVPSAKERFNVLYEMTANSTDIEAADLQVKLWTSDTSFSVVGDGTVLDVKQSASSVKTTHSFIGAIGLSNFDAVSEGGVDYYPSISVAVDFTQKYISSVSLPSLSIESGDTENVEIIDADNYGVLAIVFTYSLSWFFDSDRTLPVSSIPDDLPDIELVNSAVRFTFQKSSNFSVTGGVLDNGTAVFSNVAKNSSVLDEGKDHGDLFYIGERDSDGKIFADVQEGIVVDDNGLPIQSGNDSAVYLLDGTI
jgi:hypothetical protein